MESDGVAPAANAVTVLPARIDDGGVILVEARSHAGAEQDVRVGELSFRGVEDSIKSIAERVTAALTSVQPSKATVEFGIDVTVEAGALTGLLAKGTGGATLKITLEWNA